MFIKIFTKTALKIRVKESGLGSEMSFLCIETKVVVIAASSSRLLGNGQSNVAILHRKRLIATRLIQVDKQYFFLVNPSEMLLPNALKAKSFIKEDELSSSNESDKSYRSININLLYNQDLSSIHISYYVSGARESS